ncbi:MAG: radical SAM protein, partial [Candidatus Thorarchaeota archaeon]
MRTIEESYARFRYNCLYYFSRVLIKPLTGPDIIQIAITHRCNLKCKFCDVIKDSYKPEEELSSETIKRIIDQFKELGGKKVFFVGGEPFLRNDFFELVDYANSKELLSLVSTNGTLINEEMARKIVETPVGIVMFSIEAANAQTHDSLRGEKVFEKITNAIKLVSKIKKEKGLGINDKPILGILSVVLNSNLEQLTDIIKLTESLEIPFINFQPLQTNNTVMWEKDTTNPEWIPEERYPILDKALDDIEEYKNKARTRVTCDTKYIKEYFRCNVKEPDVKCYQNYLRVVIKPNGKLWTCLRYHEDIYNNNLKDLWYSKEMEKDRIKAKQCNSLCLQRCIYLYENDNLKQLCKNLLSKLITVDKEERSEVLMSSLKFLNEQKKILVNSKQEKTISDNKEIFEALQDIKEMKLILKKELTRAKCQNNCQFCYLMDPDFCKNIFINQNIFLFGHNQELHDKLIGNNNFNIAINELGPKKTSIIIIAKDNYKDLDKIINLIHLKNGKKIMFIFLDPKQGFEGLFNKTIPTINKAAYHIKKAKDLAEK